MSLKKTPIPFSEHPPKGPGVNMLIVPPLFSPLPHPSQPRREIARALPGWPTRHRVHHFADGGGEVLRAAFGDQPLLRQRKHLVSCGARSSAGGMVGGFVPT